MQVSHRLTDSAACLVSDKGDMSATLERMLKQAGQDVPSRRPILEINPEHPLVKRLKQEDGRFDDLSGAPSSMTPSSLTTSSPPTATSP